MYCFWSYLVGKQVYFIQWLHFLLVSLGRHMVYSMYSMSFPFILHLVVGKKAYVVSIGCWRGTSSAYTVGRKQHFHVLAHILRLMRQTVSNEMVSTCTWLVVSSRRSGAFQYLSWRNGVPFCTLIRTTRRQIIIQVTCAAAELTTGWTSARAFSYVCEDKVCSDVIYGWLQSKQYFSNIALKTEEVLNNHEKQYISSQGRKNLTCIWPLNMNTEQNIWWSS